MYGLPDSSAPDSFSSAAPDGLPFAGVASVAGVAVEQSGTASGPAPKMNATADALQMSDMVAAVGSAPGLLSWPFDRLTSAPIGYFALTLGMMMLLAGLDAVGSVFAKEWTVRQQPVLFFAGMLCFMLLYVVFAHSLHVAELSIVTMGWIVFLQVGLLLVDALRYDVTFSPSKWVAIAMIIGLQGYIILTPNPT